jgi:flagellar hook-associated protein 1 FlgK
MSAFQELSLHPGDLGVRSAVLARAEWLAQGFSQTADNLASFRGELFTQASDAAAEVNDRLDRIAKLDKSIVAGGGTGQDVAALRDTRDQLVREVAQRVGARMVENETGGITLFGAGTVLYDGQTAAKLSVGLDPSGNMQIKATRGGAIADVTTALDTGTMAGVRQARDIDVTSVTAALDAFASDVAASLNAIHSAGFGLDGVSGRPLFATTVGAAGAAHAMAVDDSLIGHPERLAASGSATDVPGGNDVAVLLANSGSTPLVGGGTISERYAAMSSTVGVMRNVADGEQSMREDTVATASALRESASGVSTDEEMINLQQFQRAFEASSRVLSTANDLFDTILKAIG